MNAFQPVPQMPPIAEINSVDILSGQCDLRGYPYQYLAVIASRNIPMAPLPGLLMAAHLLGQVGWELVNVLNCTVQHISLVAIMRRR